MLIKQEYLPGQLVPLSPHIESTYPKGNKENQHQESGLFSSGTLLVKQTSFRKETGPLPIDFYKIIEDGIIMEEYVKCLRRYILYLMIFLKNILYLFYYLFIFVYFAMIYCNLMNLFC